MTITKEGALASFYTVNKAPIKHLKVYFSPKQAGTGDPSPSNVREISGWTGLNITRCGKNLFSLWNNGYWNAGITKKWDDSSKGAVCKPIHVNSGTTFTISQTNISATYQFHEWDKYVFSTNNYTGDNNLVFAMSSNGQGRTYIAQNDSFLTAFVNIGTDTIATRKVQLELGSMATSYEPYSGTTIPVDWSAVAGTLYGGYVDLVTGELVETDWGVTLDGSSDEFWAANGTDGFYTQPQTVKPMNTILYCNRYKVHSGKMTTRDMSEGEIAMNATGWAVQVFDTSQTDWRTYLNENPLQLVGQLTEPIVHQLTPTQLSTLIGRNNIWSNADRVEVEYDLAESNDELYRRRNILMRSAPHIETANGNIAHFETDIAAPIKSAKISFSPVQSGEGTPNPTNVRPISGFTNLSLYHSGENLYVPNSNNKGYISKSGVITVDETSTYTDLIPVNLGEVYSFECTTVSVNGDTNRRIHGYNSSGTWVKQLASGTTAANTVEDRKISATIPADISYIRVSFRNQDTDVRIVKKNIVETNWQTAAGTIYGGYVDLISGELVVTHIVEEENGKVFTFTSTAAYQFGHPHCCLNDDFTKALSSHWKTTRFANENFAWINASGAFFIGREVFEAAGVQFNNEGLQAWFAAEKQKGTPIQLGGPLVTPIRYQLSPVTLHSLRGTNNIWSNANGTIEVKYWRH